MYMYSIAYLIFLLPWLHQTDNMRCVASTGSGLCRSTNKDIERIIVICNCTDTKLRHGILPTFALLTKEPLYRETFQRISLYEEVRTVRIQSFVCLRLLLRTKKIHNFHSTKPGACSSALYTADGARSR